MPQLIPELVAIRRSGIREILDMAADYKDVIYIVSGEPSFNTPAHIVEAANRAASDGFTHYTSNFGIPSLREKLVHKLDRVNGLHLTRDHVIITPGAISGVASTLLAFMEPGDEVLIPDPTWPNYELIVGVHHGIPKYYHLSEDNGFLPDLEDLERQITSRSKILIMNNPSNPAGAVFPAKLVADVMEIARRHDLFVICDDVYDQIVYEGEHVSAMKYDTDGRVASIYSFSKTYAMTGWRLGYLAAAPDVIQVVGKLIEASVSCASSVSQKAGEAALDGPQDCIAEMCSAYKRRRDLAVNLLTELGVRTVRPSGAFYLMADISPCGMESYDFARSVLKEARVALSPGGTFGPSGQNFVRISLATDDALLAEGLRRFAAFLKSKTPA